MSKQLRRQERIVAWLNRDWIWTSKTASKEFGVHQKTIKNDIKDLKARGYKIEWDVARRSYTLTEKGGSLVAGARFRESHLKAITQAANIFEDMGYNESATTMRSLADSYQTALPELLEADKDLLIRTLWLSREISPEDRMPHLEKIDEAIRHQRELQIVYQGWGRGPSESQIQPHRIIIRRGHAHLYATTSTSPCKVLNLRIDRIKDCEVTDIYFTVHEDLDLDGYFEPIFDVFHDGEVYDVKIRFSPDVAWWLEENRIHPSQKVTTGPNGTTLLEMRVTGIIDLARMVLSFGGQAEVIQPEKLIEKVRESVKGLRDVYLKKG